jgi:hypothetical protein
MHSEDGIHVICNMAGEEIWRGPELANLSWADLTGANLSEADLRVANLSRANLHVADLRWADLSSADLSGANLRGANLGGAVLSSADLHEANLRSANLSEANLTSANLSGANLTSANLSGANLSRADLSVADLSEANLHEADLGGARYCPPVLLLASWGVVSDELCLDLMRYDAANHPEPGKFIEWANGGDCPYSSVQIIRAANFLEKRELIKPDFLDRPVKSALQLCELLIAEKCKK